MSELLASLFDDAPVRREAQPAPAGTSASEDTPAESASAETAPQSRFDRNFARVRRVFIWACYGSVAAMLSWVLLFIIEAIVPGTLMPVAGAVPTALNSVFEIYFVVVAVGIPALTPFVSLVYMVLVVFKGLEIDTDEVLLSTFAVLSSAFALVMSMDNDVCADPTQTCFGEKFGFVFDQFSKGSLGDVFDIYSLGLSDISIDAVDGLTKLYVMNFRMLSAAYLVAVALMLYGYFSQVRQRRRIRAAARREKRLAAKQAARERKARSASADAPRAAAAATSPEPAE